METILNNVSLFTRQTQALFIYPAMMVLIIIYAEQTQFVQLFQIKSSDLLYYLVFSLIIIIPQLIVNIFLLHTLEIVRGIRLFDYFTFAAFRYKTRLTNWINNHWPLDRSISSAWRSIDSMCFSSQFYFAITISTWGILLLMFGLIIILNNACPIFQDPYLFYYIVTLSPIIFIGVILAKQLFYALGIWEIYKKKAERKAAEERNIGLGVCPLDYFKNEKILLEDMHNDLFKAKFLSNNKEWIINNLKGIISKNDTAGKKIYEKIIVDADAERLNKNNEAKEKRNRALLPYNRSEDNCRKRKQKDEKRSLSTIVEEDFPNENDKKHDTKSIIAKITEGSAPFRIIHKWHEKALESLKYQEMIASIHMKKKKEACIICGQNFYLQVQLGKPFDLIFHQYQRETIGIPFDRNYWEKYYERHQQFRTMCAECAFVNNVMQTKLTEYKIKIEAEKEDYLDAVFKPKTYKLLQRWIAVAQERLAKKA